MPRNRAKNVYITIGLPIHSPVLQQLEEESRMSGTSLAKLIPVKLSELYSGSLRTLPIEHTPKADIQSAEANAMSFLESDDE